MSIKKVLSFPHQILSRPCERIQDFDETLDRLVRDLWDTLESGPGVGLAAPQIGVCRSVAVINTSRDKRRGETAKISKGGLVLINPILVQGDGIQLPREGCLSVPDLLANVIRYDKCHVRAFNLRGEIFQVEAHGFEALALQHEIDHLNGVLFLDRVTNLKTDLFRRNKR